MLRNFQRLHRNIKHPLIRKACTANYFAGKRKAHQSAAPTVIVEKDDNITIIGINREISRNSLDISTTQQLNDAITAFEADTSSPVAVLYGVGGSFCAGLDVVELEEMVAKGSLNFLLGQEGSVGPTRRHLRKPIVCGINGFCVGGGLELALLCDLRVMEDTAVLGFLNRHLGVPICDGGTVRLAQAVGYSRALDIIATGRRVSGKEAFEMGLVNRIVATGTSLGQAVNLAFSIAKFSQAGLHHDRNSLHFSAYNATTFREAVQNEIMLTSKELIEEMAIGVKKFINSDTKGAKIDSFNIKEKEYPDWEKSEIAEEIEYLRRKKAS